MTHATHTKTPAAVPSLCETKRLRSETESQDRAENNENHTQQIDFSVVRETQMVLTFPCCTSKQEIDTVRGEQYLIISRVEQVPRNHRRTSSQFQSAARRSAIRNPQLLGWLGSQVASVMDSGAVGPGFKSQSWRCRVTVLGKLFISIVPLFTKQQNWQQSS